MQSRSEAVMRSFRSFAGESSISSAIAFSSGFSSAVHKATTPSNINYVLIAYLLNLAIVSLNLAVYFRNVALDKKNAQESEK